MRSMAVLQALLALVARSAGKILNAIFGWAVHALFGKTTPRDQTILSAVVAAAVAWPLLAAGVAAPKVAAFALALVPLPRSVSPWIVRIVWLVLALAVPVVVGVVVAARGRHTKRESVAKRVLRGFPLTLGLALAFLIMFVSVPAMRLAALVRRQKSADVPVATDAENYRQIVELVVETLGRHGFALAPAQPPWWVKAPMRILRWFGGSAFGEFVPAHIAHYEDGGIAVSFYSSGILLRGKRDRLTLARGLIEEAVVHSEGLETLSAEAQETEREVRKVWKVFDSAPAGAKASTGLFDRLEELTLRLAKLDVEYDEWQVIYRQILQLERALRGERQLLEATVSAGPSPTREETGPSGH